MSENTYTHISPQAYFNLYKDLQQHNNPPKTKEQKIAADISIF
jgi:hypothetical protein